MVVKRMRISHTEPSSASRPDPAPYEGDRVDGDSYDTYRRAVSVQARLLRGLGLQPDRLGWSGEIVRLAVEAPRAGYTVLVAPDDGREPQRRVVCDA